MSFRKAASSASRREGLDAFRSACRRCRRSSPTASSELKSWDDVKLLTVAVDRLRQWWRPGLLCIGDAAHAMSPIGGVGINLAVQDAVAAANRLAAPLKAGTRERRRSARHSKRGARFPVRFTQRCSSPSRSGSSAARSRARSGRSRRCCSSCSARFRCCGASRRGCLASASGPSTCTRPTCWPRS